MAVFKISGQSLTLIRSTPFSREKELQKITEQNLEAVLGVKFIYSEFPIGRFRLDTVGFDEEANSFVIIEYKKDHSISVIDQGYAYLSTVLNHRAELVLLYNEREHASRKRSDFDWSQSRVLFVSPSFNDYQLEAANFKDLPIELWEVTRYSNDTIRYDRIRSHGRGADLGSLSKASKDIEEVRAKVKVFTEDAILDRAGDEIREAYGVIKGIVYQLDPDAEERVRKTMTGYYSGGKGLVWVKPGKTSVTLFLRKGTYKDKAGNTLPKGWGDYPTIRLSADEIDPIFIRKLIERASGL